jgi:hypothetical protein
MPMRRGIKSKKEVTTKTPRKMFLIENPLKKKKNTQYCTSILRKSTQFFGPKH